MVVAFGLGPCWPVFLIEPIETWIVMWNQSQMAFQVGLMGFHRLAVEMRRRWSKKRDDSFPTAMEAK